ncbi:MAG: IS66 family transposase, partial [Halobacteriales archaeon]
ETDLAVDPSEVSKAELIELVEELQARIAELEDALEAKQERIETLEARLKRYENAHTPPSKQRSHPTDDPDDNHEDEDEEDDLRTDGGTVGRNPGHDPAWRPIPEPDREVDVTADACPDCGESLGDPTGVTPRFIEEIPDPDPIETTRYNLHHYACECCGEDVQATHPDCPAAGGFGVTVQAQAALARYEYRLPYRKVADRFDHRFDLDLSAASAWHATERVARAGREEYEAIRERLRSADVVHIDETGFNVDGQQWWLWTFTAGDDVLYALRESRGSGVIEEVLDEDFDGTIVCDGWSAYPAITDDRQRCWAHLLREADEVAADHAEAEPIAGRLHRLFDGLQAFLAADPEPEQRARMRKQAHETVEALVAEEFAAEEVEEFIGKIEGGLGHWFAFVTDPAVNPTNNAAENALREPVVLRKIIGTLRTESGRFVHETLLSLLATWKQQGRNPYEELKRTARPSAT